MAHYTCHSYGEDQLQTYKMISHKTQFSEAQNVAADERVDF